jgi:hypothetical protein
MENNLDQVITDYNERARQIFFTLFAEFRKSVSSIDRRRDENVFQQFQSKYLNTLKLQLENVAREILQKNERMNGFDRLEQTMPAMIAGYINEFLQKIRSL